MGSEKTSEKETTKTQVDEIFSKLFEKGLLDNPLNNPNNSNNPNNPSMPIYQIGKTLIFYKSNVTYVLNTLYQQYKLSCTIAIQRVARGYLTRSDPRVIRLQTAGRDLRLAVANIARDEDLSELLRAIEQAEDAGLPTHIYEPAQEIYIRKTRRVLSISFSFSLSLGRYKCLYALS